MASVGAIGVKPAKIEETAEREKQHQNDGGRAEADRKSAVARGSETFRAFCLSLMAAGSGPSILRQPLALCAIRRREMRGMNSRIPLLLCHGVA